MAFRHSILLLIALLTACGDSSQEFRAVESETSGQTEDLPTREVNTTADFIPLASHYLRPHAEAMGTAMLLEDVRFASALGHLGERIHAGAEALGLTSIPDGFALSHTPSPLPEGLSWEMSSQSDKFAFQSLDADTRPGMIAEMQLKLGDVPIHNARVKMVVENAETTWISGSRPTWLSATRRPEATPFSLSIAQARQYAARELSFPEWRFHSPSKIYIAEKSRARAAYLFTVTAEYRAGERAPWVPLEVAIDADVGRILWQRPLAMHASATAQLYVENKAVSNTLETVVLPELTNGTRLSHNLFDVYNCGRTPRYLETTLGNSCQQRASASAGAFNISYTESDYDDLIAYAGITRAMTKFRALDESSLRADWDQTKWPGSRSSFGLESSGSGGSPRRLMVFVNTETQSPTTNSCGKDTTPDNAQYVWQGRTGGGNPEILIGYGGYNSSRCGVFQDLGKDMDVVMHEFGHHIVFRGLSNSKQQSVALHEGFADYLTYVVTGNNLLGENTSPGRSALRSGTTRQRTYTRFSRKSDGTYISVPQALSAPHSVGELWSGILWEMRDALGRDASNAYKMDKIVWDSIDLIKSDGDLYDGVLAISESAKRYAARFNDNAEQLQNTIHSIFVKYEFAALGSDGRLMRTAMMGSEPTTAEPQKAVTKKKSWGCGDLSISSTNSGASSKTGTSSALFTILLAIPLLIPSLSALRSRLTRHPIRVRIHKPKN